MRAHVGSVLRRCCHAIRLSIAIGLVFVHPHIGTAQQQDEARDACIRAVAQGVALPEAQVELQTLQPITPSSTYGGRLVRSCRCRILSDVAHTVGWVCAEVGVKDGHLYSLQWLSQEPAVVRRLAQEFAAACVPQWSEAMVLTSESFTDHQTAEFEWRERAADAWTGTRVYVLVHVDQPGRPYLFGSYVATPRTLDDVRVTRENATHVAEELLRRRGYVTRLETAELYLDDADRPFPHWYLSLRVGREEGDYETLMNVLVNALTGEIVWPPPDEQE